MKQKTVHFVIVVIVWMLVCLAPSTSAAAFGALGNEFVVNSSTANQQAIPSIAIAPNGNFVIVWQHQVSGMDWDIRGQRYDPSGNTLGSEFLINTVTALAQQTPAVAMDDAGNFVVVWSDQTPSFGNNLISAQLYNAAGIAQGGQITISLVNNHGQSRPHVAMDSDGDFVVVWQRSININDSGDIYAQRYNAAGITQGDEFLVNTTTVNEQTDPRLTMDASGNFTVVWTHTVTSGNEDIYARRFNALGIAQDTDFRVNTFTAGTQFHPSIAADMSGNFVITWTSYNQDGDAGGIYAQRYNAAGATIGSEFLVNTTTIGPQVSSFIATMDNGAFVITWEGGAAYDVYAQEYSDSGIARGGEYLVNQFTANYQGYVAAAINQAGNFVVAWTSDVTGANELDIYARRYSVAPPALSVSSTFISYAALMGAGLTPPQTVTIQNNSVSTVSFTADNLPLWLTCSAPGTSTLAPGASTTMDCRADSDSLTPQTYSGSFQLVPDGELPSTINVSFTVNNVPPILTASPLSLMYSAPEDSGLTPAQTLTISNMAALGFMDFAVGTLPSWLTCTEPATHMLAGGQNTTIDCRANTASLTPQIYNSSFQITSNTGDVSGSPQTVNVSFTVINTVSTFTFTENDFYAAFEAERVAFPAIAQGIADFVVGGINLTVTLNTGEAGRVTFTLTGAAGFVSIQISSITALNGGAASQAYIDTINRDLPSLLTAALDNLVLARFGAGQDVQSITIDSTTMTIGVLP